jgi:hypothetical protein
MAEKKTVMNEPIGRHTTIRTKLNIKPIKYKGSNNNSEHETDSYYNYFTEDWNE